MKTTEHTRHAVAQEYGASVMADIHDMLAGLDTDDDQAREAAHERIYESPLSVAYIPTYEILISWGGPACRITGRLNEHDEPETASLEYQDCGTPWTTCYLTTADENALLRYARQFYFDRNRPGA